MNLEYNLDKWKSNQEYNFDNIIYLYVFHNIYICQVKNKYFPSSFFVIKY